MGGPGSGPRRQAGKKRALELCPRLTLADLRRCGALGPNSRAHGECVFRPLGAPLGVPDWSTRAAVLARYSTVTKRTRGTMAVSVQHPDASAAATEVRMVTTRTRGKTLRWWWRCGQPTQSGRCTRRVTALYFAAGRVGCRLCLDLAYLSSQTWDRRVRAAALSGTEGHGSTNRDVLSALSFRLKVLNLLWLRTERSLATRVGRIRPARRARSAAILPTARSPPRSANTGIESRPARAEARQS